MGIEQTDWGREAALLRPAKLTLAVFKEASAPDVERPWVPDRLLPLYGGGGLESLNPSQRLRYNHAYARQLVAEFIWVERLMIVAPLERLYRTRRLDQDQTAVLRSFISDEHHHIESFSRLEDLATSADQPAAKSLYQPPPAVRGMVAMAARFPVALSFWADAIGAFEQYALEIGKSCHQDESVDPLFREVFVTHARDEARHCRLDTLIGSWLQGEAGALWNAVNGRLLPLFLGAYRSVHWGLEGPLRELAQTHPETSEMVPALLAEARALRRSPPVSARSE